MKRKLKRRKNKTSERPIDTTGITKKNKLYNYDVLSNQAVLLKNQCVRFYHEDGSYLELEPEANGHLTIRASGKGLTRLNLRPAASNHIHLSAVPYDMMKF